MSKKVISSISEYEEIHGTFKGYYEQFKNTASDINIGDEFVVMPDTWQESTQKVLFIDEKVALTEEIKGLSAGRRELYHSSGDMIGWKYQDPRASYRLQNIN